MFAGKRRLWIIVGAALAIGVIGGGTGIAVGMGGGDNDQPITGPALETASDAALEHTGEGVVTETEIGDEDSYYEVEVTLDDGSQVDVQLDEEFNVVGEEADDDSTDDHDDSDTD